MTVSDCEQCLQLEPTNLKALLRKAQALYNLSKYREVSFMLIETTDCSYKKISFQAYDECTKILSIDSNHEWAKAKINEMKPKISSLPPANAFRYENAPQRLTIHY